MCQKLPIFRTELPTFESRHRYVGRRKFESNVEKAHAFAKHLADDFQPQSSENEPEEEEALIQLLRVSLPIGAANQTLQKS
jgi:hypothetical protein